MAFKAGTSGSSGLWRGVIRDDTGAVVWTCPHYHRNRDQSTASNYAARSCACAHLKAATDPSFGEWMKHQSVNNPAHPTMVRRAVEQIERAPEVRKALGID